MTDESNTSADDEIEALYVFFKGKLQNFDKQKLRQHAETIAYDITRFAFDFSSECGKFERYGTDFVEIMRQKSDDAIIKHVDLYWIHEQLASMSKCVTENDVYAYNLILDASTKSADENISNAGSTISENIIMREFYAARYLMDNLSSFDGLIFDSVLSDVKWKNVRNFIDAGLKHERFAFDEANIVQFYEESGVVLKLHECIKENLVFLIEFFVTNVIHKLSTKSLKKVIKLKDDNGNTIFHLACERRIKFLIEDLWTLTQKALEDYSVDMEKYLLHRNIDQNNAFQLAFKMPLKYTKYDFANEIKSKHALLNYYRDPGPLELEMYNFESSLNMIFDIARKNVNDSHKKSLVVGGNSAKNFNATATYSYSKEFRDFRSDFIQLRFHFITKLSSINKENIHMWEKVYFFLSHYVDYYMHTNCRDEDKIMELFEKLSYDGFLHEFFKVLIFNYFTHVLYNMRNVENVEKLIQITIKALSQKELLQVLTKSGFGGNNSLQLAINSGNFEFFRVIWSSFEFNEKAVTNWMLSKNIENNNALYMIIQNSEFEMLKNVLEYFSAFLDETQIMFIFDATGKKNYKFLDIAVLYYDRQIFNLLIDFVQSHLSIECQKTLISTNIISLAVSKWQESPLIDALTMIENLFDETEIKNFIFSTNWHGQTAFHIASRNSNLSHLQGLCKFAHYYLTDSDFVEILSAKDSNEYSM